MESMWKIVMESLWWTACDGKYVKGSMWWEVCEKNVCDEKYVRLTYNRECVKGSIRWEVFYGKDVKGSIWLGVCN